MQLTIVYFLDSNYDRRPPTMLSKSTVVHALIGSQAILECLVDAGPRTQINWRKQGQLVQPLAKENAIDFH